MPNRTEMLARGPWTAEQVQVTWSETHYEATSGKTAAADAAIADLARRGSPSHDGLAARMSRWELRDDGRLVLELQPLRWALRLVEGDASNSLAALCVTRAADGSWLAGRRAAWLSSWPGRWALGAGGAVDVGENPIDTLARELQEEWGVAAARLQGEALVRLPHDMVMFVGQAWLEDDAEVVRDAEHDTHAWWPPDPDDWPPEADEPLRRMAKLLA